MLHPVYEELEQLPDRFPGFTTLSSNVIYLLGCGALPQFENTLRGLLDHRYCPFCDPKRHAKALASTEGWVTIANEFPAKGTQEMYLIIPRDHVTDVRTLSDSDWMQIGQLVTKLNLSGGGLVMRVGMPHFHSGTIPHLHMNAVVPDPDQEYRLPRSKPADGRADNYKRLLGFREELRAKGGLDWLMKSGT